MDEYYKYIDQLGLKPNPSGDGTLADLKLALSTDNPAEYYPVGTELEDTYDGHSNPLIVAQYLDNTNNEKYGGAEGVILIRKCVEPTSQRYGSTNSYITSDVRAFLNTTYYENSSNELKSVISEIKALFGTESFTARWFLMAAVEVGINYTPQEGIFWKYWQQRTGSSNLQNNYDNMSTTRRVVGINGAGAAALLRTSTGTKGTGSSRKECIAGINSNGGTANAINCTSTDYGVLPACFIAKS